MITNSSIHLTLVWLISQAQPYQVPENLQSWPKSCQRLHYETAKCENGLKSCSQHRIDYWRRRCEHDEPHEL